MKNCHLAHDDRGSLFAPHTIVYKRFFDRSALVTLFYGQPSYIHEYMYRFFFFFIINCKIRLYTYNKNNINNNNKNVEFLQFTYCRLVVFNRFPKNFRNR